MTASPTPAPSPRRIAECLLCRQPGELRHTGDGYAIVRCPNVCIATMPAPVSDDEAIDLWNAAMGGVGTPTEER